MWEQWHAPRVNQRLQLSSGAVWLQTGQGPCTADPCSSLKALVNM